MPNKTCRCGNEYVQYSTLQNKCYVCLATKAKTTREKDERKAHKKAKDGLKTRGDYAKGAQTAFNRYIRARDHNEPCISCRREPKKRNAGHYRSVGAAPELRFDEKNCHLQCEHCNSYQSGNAIEYRIHLVHKIGLDSVEWLEGPHPPKKYTIDELKEIKTGFNAWARELEKELE